MPDFIPQAEIQLGAQGRLVIPAAFRKVLGFESGDTLIARLDEDRLVLEKVDTIKHRLKTRFAKVPKEVNLAAELLMERREAAKHEAEG
ncbi:MAG: AbrB/MazE/SpoVT family DNA-binding domain-containing protein [Candidatus Competibacteraceae bacterium]